FISASLPAAAQRRGSVAANKSTAAGTKCSGAWTGTVTYTRTQGLTNNKTEQRVSGRGEDTTNFEMKYDYAARVAVIEIPGTTGSTGKGTVNHTMTSIEKIHAVEKNSCD